MEYGSSCSCYPEDNLHFSSMTQRSPWPFPPSNEFDVHSVHVHCDPESSPVLQWQPSWTQLLLLEEQRNAVLLCLVITRILNLLGTGISSWQSGFQIRAVVRLCFFFTLCIMIPGGSDLWSTLTISLKWDFPKCNKRLLSSKSFALLNQNTHSKWRLTKMVA